MSKIRRGSVVFVTWIGDHSARHVDVYEARKLVVQWDLDAKLPTKGKASARILALIEELEKEGAL